MTVSATRGWVASLHPKIAHGSGDDDDYLIRWPHAGSISISIPILLIHFIF
jgi:hypothetical protein